MGVTRGGEWTKMEHSRNIFFDKVNKAHLINKMKLEEHNILDGRTWYHFKYDNTAPKTAFLFTFLPYNMDRAWTYEGGRQHTANGGFTMTHKITHGDIVIQEGEMVFDIKANDGSKFEMEHLHKMTMTEESPFYGMVFWYTGRYGKTVERKMTVVFDKINKSFLFVPKMTVNTVMTIDGEKHLSLSLTTPRLRSTSSSSGLLMLSPRITFSLTSGNTPDSADASGP